MFTAGVVSAADGLSFTQFENWQKDLLWWIKEPSPDPYEKWPKVFVDRKNQYKDNKQKRIEE